MQDKLVPDPAAPGLLDLPTRHNGTHMLSKHTFFRRLLTKEVELRSSMAADVAAAQTDLKLLSLEQLAVLRSQSLAFVTASRSHEAHNNFIASLERLLCERLVRRYAVEPLTAISVGPIMALGRQMVLAFGVFSVLVHGLDEGGECSPAAHTSADDEGSAQPQDTPTASVSSKIPSLPEYWAFLLDPLQWDGCGVALLHTGSLCVHVVRDGSTASLQKAGITTPVAVVTDRSRPWGKTPMLDWEVSVVEAPDHLVAELRRAERSSVQQKRHSVAMGEELSAALKMRCTWSMPEEAEGNDAIEPEENELAMTIVEGHVERVSSRFRSTPASVDDMWQTMMAARKATQKPANLMQPHGSLPSVISETAHNAPEMFCIATPPSETVDSEAEEQVGPPFDVSEIDIFSCDWVNIADASTSDDSCPGGLFDLFSESASSAQTSPRQDEDRCSQAFSELSDQTWFDTQIQTPGRSVWNRVSWEGETMYVNIATPPLSPRLSTKDAVRMPQCSDSWSDCETCTPMSDRFLSELGDLNGLQQDELAELFADAQPRALQYGSLYDFSASVSSVSSAADLRMRARGALSVGAQTGLLEQTLVQLKAFADVAAPPQGVEALCLHCTSMDE